MTGSRFAEHFNAAARPMIWEEHGETVTLTDTDADASSQTSDITVIWKRVKIQPGSGPTGNAGKIGIGAISYSGEVTAAVRLTDLPSPPGPRSYLTRDGIEWEIVFCERQDEYTWILYLQKPDKRDRMPSEFRR